MSLRTGYWKESLRRLIYRRTFYLSIVGAIIAVLLLGSLLILHFERKTNPMIQTYGDAVWLSVVTMTTVGYGDKVPITPAGKVTCMVTMVLGIALVTTFVTAQASMRIDKAKRRAKGLEKKTALRKHFLVCGWNARGEHVLARLISAVDKERVSIVLLCEAEEKPVDDEAVFFYRGSPVSERNLRRVNAAEARAVVLLADESRGGDPGDIDARTVLTALTVKSLNPDARITAEVLEPENVGHLERAGVGEILDYSLIAGSLLARSALRYGLIELVTTLSTRDAAGARIYGIPAGEEMAGKDVDEVSGEMKRQRGLVVLGIRKKGKEISFERGEILASGDVLMVLSEEEPPDALG